MTASETTDQDISPLVAQQRLTQELVALRADAELTQAQVAEQLGVSVSTVIRSESFPGVCGPTFLRALGACYHLSQHEQRALIQLRAECRAQGWWVRQGLVVPTGDRTRVGLRGDVCQVYGWAPTLVPELVQTAEYARAVETLFGLAGQAEQIKSTVASLVAVQERVQRRGIVQRYVVDESILRRRVGGTAVMICQLEALSALARCGRLRVLAHCGPMPGLYEGFELCTIPGLDEQMVYFPQRREIHLDTPLPSGHTLGSLQHVMERLWESAASPEVSLELIEQARMRMLPGAANSPTPAQTLVPARSVCSPEGEPPTTAHAHESAGEG